MLVIVHEATLISGLITPPYGFNYYGNKSNFTTNLCNKTRKIIEKSNGKKINLWYFV